MGYLSWFMFAVYLYDLFKTQYGFIIQKTGNALVNKDVVNNLTKSTSIQNSTAMHNKGVTSV